MVLNNILDWDGTNLAPADFGTQLFAVLRDSTGTRIEIVEVDPASITSTTLTLLKRGLDYGGAQTEVPANKLAWPANDTTVQLGTDVPQLLANFFDLGGNQTATGLKTFTQFPVKSGTTTPTAGNELATKDYVDATATGTTIVDGVLVSGIAGETFALAGKVVYFKESGQKWWLADADAIITSKNVKRGIAQQVAVANDPITVLISGTDKNQTGLIPGSKYYASGTPGALSLIAGANSIFLGWAKSATALIWADTDDLADYATKAESSAVGATVVELVHSTGLALVYSDATSLNKPGSVILTEGFATIDKRDSGAGTFKASEAAGQTLLQLNSQPEAASFRVGQVVTLSKNPVIDADLSTWTYAESDSNSGWSDGGVVSSKRRNTRIGGNIVLSDYTQIQKVISGLNIGQTYNIVVSCNFLDSSSIFGNYFNSYILSDGVVVASKNWAVSGVVQSHTFNFNLVASNTTHTIALRGKMDGGISGSLSTSAIWDWYLFSILTPTGTTPEQVTISEIHGEVIDATLDAYTYTEIVGAAQCVDNGVVSAKRQMTCGPILLNAGNGNNFDVRLTKTLTNLAIGRNYVCKLTTDLGTSSGSWSHTAKIYVLLDLASITNFGPTGHAAETGVVNSFNFTATATSHSLVFQYSQNGNTSDTQTFTAKLYNFILGENELLVAPALGQSYAINDEVKRTSATFDLINKKITIVATRKMASYYLKRAQFQGRNVGSTSNIWLTRNWTVRLSPTALIALGATTLAITGDQTAKIQSGDTVDIFESNNSLRERKVLTSVSFGAGVTTIVWAGGLQNAYTVNAFVERVDVLPTISLVATDETESFQTPVYVRSAIDTANSEVEDYYTLTTTPNKDVSARILLTRNDITTTPYAKSFIIGLGAV